MKQLSEPAGLTSDVQFPGVYDAAIKWNLAEQLCPEYGKEPTPYIMARADASLQNMMDQNLSLDMGAVAVELISMNRRYNINTD
jgi:hypothetical protein